MKTVWAVEHHWCPDYDPVTQVVELYTTEVEAEKAAAFHNSQITQGVLDKGYKVAPMEVHTSFIPQSAPLTQNLGEKLTEALINRRQD